MSSHQYAHKRHPPHVPERRGSRSRAEPKEPVAPHLNRPRIPNFQLPPLEAAPPPRPVVIAAPLVTVVAAPIERKQPRAEIASLKPPRPFVPPSAGKRLRPSLSEQLATIRDQSATILEEMKAKFDVLDSRDASSGESPLCHFSPRSVRVGTRICNWPGVLKFYHDRAEYHFTHPQHKSVQMLMRYRDMSHLSLARAERRLRFRIEHSLEYFASEYDHYDPAHHLDIVLAAPADVEALAAASVWGRMQAMSIPR